MVQPNLGLGYLASIIEDAGHDVEILDSGKKNLSWNDFTGLIKRNKYDLAGIQMYSNEIPSVAEHIRLIKRHSPETVVICGGAHISGDPRGAMSLLKDVRFGFAGEAEAGMEKFIRLQKEDYGNPALLKTIPNLVWRSGGEVEVNPGRSFQNLDEIRYPAWHLLSPNIYPSAPHGTFCRQRPVAPLIISRGCPFQCAFCGGHTITGREIRYRSVENAVSEIMFLREEHGVREIHIEDDNFTLKKEYVAGLCEEIIRRVPDLTFALPNGVRLDTLNEETLRLMERAGFYSMAVGIESGSDRVLKLMNKNLTRELIRERIDLIKRVTDINLTGFFLIGYPGESEQEILETINFAKSLKLDKASFMFAMPLPGSELWESYREKNPGIDWDTFFYYRIIPGVSEIPAGKLKRLHRKAMLEFYLRPEIIAGLLREIRTPEQVGILGRRIFNILASGRRSRRRLRPVCSAAGRHAKP